MMCAMCAGSVLVFCCIMWFNLMVFRMGCVNWWRNMFFLVCGLRFVGFCAGLRMVLIVCLMMVASLCISVRLLFVLVVLWSVGSWE
jgi:hypothetical protein